MSGTPDADAPARMALVEDRPWWPAGHPALAAVLNRPAVVAARIVVEDAEGRPLVIENRPIGEDGRPMPTLYWLVGRSLVHAVSQIESGGGVREAESAVDPERLAAARRSYATRRDSSIPPGHRGPRPRGGVGGTASGVKCLHAHLAYWLAGGPDPVGEWVAHALQLRAPQPRQRAGVGIESGGGVVRAG
jgi:hypothetical protein